LEGSFVTLTGKFHVHLTLLCNSFDSSLKSWKTTIIQLKKGEQEQIDIMLTKHYFIPSRKTQSLDDIKKDIAQAVQDVEQLGYKVVRVKLEHESLPTLPPSRENYRECHIKLKLPKGYVLDCPEGFVKSSNPLAQLDEYDVYFINKRWYDGCVDSIEAEVKQAIPYVLENNTVVVLEAKVESVVLDSNQMLDKWWA
jgi:hypothetical protein